MDPVEIMLHENRVVPNYHPVISAETQLVVGYELKHFFMKRMVLYKVLTGFLKI
ncbi:hypothetical protein NSQ82_05225 [Caldifermentibacillus hisashii]|uniref:hypothetical protein n=1 Tax=Caldifermentibacillus hisashii TaxID=996558 RepID=UPI0031B6C455